MDKSKQKDGMLAAGKKRLEQFRQNKQGKGNTSKQNNQDADVEQGMQRLDVEHDSHKGSKVKGSPVGNDSEGPKARNSKMHTPIKNRGPLKTKSGDRRKNSTHDVAVERSSGKSSPVRMDSDSATDSFHAKSLRTAADNLEECKGDGDELLTTGNGELCLTLDSSQLQPSITPEFTSQFQGSLEHNCSGSVAGSDVSIDVADLVSPGVNHVYNTENENSEQNVSRDSLETFQACDQEQCSAVKSFLPKFSPCMSSDHPDRVDMEVKSEYDDKMQRADNVKEINPLLSYSSSLIASSLQSIESEDKGGEPLRLSEHESKSRTAGVVTSCSHTLDDAVQVAHDVEGSNRVELNTKSLSISQSKAESMVNVDDHLVSTIYPENESSSVSQTLDMENLADSHSEGIAVKSNQNETYDFYQPQTAELEVSRVNSFSESASNSHALFSINNHGSECSEGTPLTSLYVNTRELLNDHVSHELRDFSPMTDDGGSQSLETSSVDCVSKILADSQGNDHGIDGSAVTSVTSFHGITSELHGEDMSHDAGDLVSLVADGGSLFLETSSVNPAEQISAGLQSHGKDHGMEGSEDTSVALLESNTTEPRDEDLSHESGDMVSCTSDNRHEPLEASYLNTGIEFYADSQGVVDDSVKPYSLDCAGVDVDLTCSPPAGSLEPDRISLANGSGVEESCNSSCEVGVSAVQKEGRLDREETEVDVLDGSLVVDDSHKTTCEASGFIEHVGIPPIPTLLTNTGVQNSDYVTVILGDRCCGEPSSDQEGSKANVILNQSSEPIVSFTNQLDCGNGVEEHFLPDHLFANNEGQYRVEDDMKIEERKPHSPSLSLQENILDLSVCSVATEDSGPKGSILYSDNSGTILKDSLEHPSKEDSETIATKLMTPDNGKETTHFPIAGTSHEILEREESIKLFDKVQPSLESSTALTKVTELDGDICLGSTTSISGLAASPDIADGIQSNASIEGMGSDVRGPCVEPEVASSLVDIEIPEQEKPDPDSMAGRKKPDTERLPFLLLDEANITETADVCSNQADSESKVVEVLKPSAGSSCAFSDFHESYETAHLLGSSHVCLDELSPLDTNANEAAEDIVEQSVSRSLSEDVGASIVSSDSRITRNTDLSTTRESESIFHLPLETVQVGQDIETKGIIESEMVIKQLQDSLCMKETESEIMFASMKAQSAKNSEEREMFAKFILHVMQQLSPFVPEELIVDKNLESYSNILNSGSVNFNQLIEDYDVSVDKIHKNFEEKRQVAQRNLETMQAIKDVEIEELLKKVEDISLKYANLQRDLDANDNQLKSTTGVLEELLAAKGEDIDRLSNMVSELTHKCDRTMNEKEKAVEKSLKMEGNIQQLEATLTDKEIDNRRLSDDVLELTKKLDLAVLELATAAAERVKVDEQFKMVQASFSATENDLKQTSDNMFHLSQKFDSTLGEMSRLLEEKGNLELELQHCRNLNLEQANKTRVLEDLLLVRDTDLENLQTLNVEQGQNMRHLEDLCLVRDTELERVQKLYECEREGHLNVMTQARALEEKIAKLLNCSCEARDAADADAISSLVVLVSSLHDQYKAISTENKDLMERVVKSDAAYEKELSALTTFLSSKDTELVHAQEKLDLLRTEREQLLNMETQANDLVEKIAALVKSPIEALDGNALGMLEILVSSLVNQYEEISTTNNDLTERITDSDTAHERDLSILKMQLIEKGVELSHLQEDMDSLMREREAHLNVQSRARALAEKSASLLDFSPEPIDADAFGVLERLLPLLHDQYESIFNKHSEVVARAADSYAASEKETSAFRAHLSEKELELSQMQEKIDLLTKELNQTKEDGERKLLEAEQKGLGYRERLSLAVTKGKGLVQQRDNLKQQLAEKNSDFEALTLSYEQELHAKTVALNEAESKAKMNLEAGERVEALESELSYIRNSSNALRESFLQKDAVLQKLEELLEDANFPEGLQTKDTYEKVEWLLEASSQKMRASIEVPSEVVLSRGLDPFLIAEQASQAHEIEQLNKKCDEYLRKYRSMAEELAMLEQSLLERNVLIQRWEEMLENVDMPATIRGKEPEDKIQWLAMAVADANNSIAKHEADLERLQISADTLHRSLQEIQEQNSVLSSELLAKEQELTAVALELANMTSKSISAPKSMSESSNEVCRPAVGCEGTELMENYQERSHQLSQSENLAVLRPEIQTLLCEVLQASEVEKVFADTSTITALVTSLKLVVESSKIWLAESNRVRHTSSELSLALRNVEDTERQLESLQEALDSKTLQVSNLKSQLEGFPANITSLENQIDQLEQEVKAKTDELSHVRFKLTEAQLEVSQEKERHTSTREKLSMAVRKGKSVLQQRDNYKLILDERVAELDQLKRDLESEGVTFNEAKQSFKNQLQELEAELSSSRIYTTTLEKSIQENMKTLQKSGEALDKIGMPGSIRSGDLMEKIQWVSQFVLDLQRKVGLNEQEARKSKKASELLSLELEDMQAKMESVSDELMNAEKNILLLIEEKKLAEASKAEAGLRLERALANVNSLLFERSESKETQAMLEQENSSLKDSLAAQTEEIRSNHKRADERLKDFYKKVHGLRVQQSAFLDRVKGEFLKSLEFIGGTRSLIVGISGDIEKCDSSTLLSARKFKANLPSKWETQNLSTNEFFPEWAQGDATESMRLLCEEMEVEIQQFDSFLDNAADALKQDSAANCELLSELRDHLGAFMKEMETLKKDADTALTREEISQNHERLALEEVLKTIVENMMSCVEEVEGLQGQPGNFIPPPFPFNEGWQNLAIPLFERFSSSFKGLTQTYQHTCAESKKQNEQLRLQLKEAIEAMNEMDKQQQLELRKCLEELEAKDGILKSTNGELCSLRDILTTKNQEGTGLIAAMKESESMVEKLSTEVEELQTAKQELEASLAKASSRFHATVNNFNKFQSLSEKLIEEAESLHLLLEDRDAEISSLKDEVAHKAGEIIDLQNSVNERTADLSQIFQQIEGLLGEEVSGREQLPNPGRRKEIFEGLTLSIRGGSENLRVQLARKDALLQDIQLRNDDLARKVHALEFSVQESHRVVEERGAVEHVMIPVEAEEKGTRGKHATPSTALVTHGRAGRKTAVDYSAVDVDAESVISMADLEDEDKGHVLKPLTSSMLVPRGARILVDRLDSFWVSGERLFRRKPGARLSVILYWFLLHAWIVAVLL